MSRTHDVPSGQDLPLGPRPNGDDGPAELEHTLGRAITPELLRTLALNEGRRQVIAETGYDPALRVAGYLETPPALLEDLSRDESEPVRWTVAANPRASGDTLEALSSDPRSSVRGALARNPSTSASVLSALASDEDAGVRQAVAANDATPVAVLELLANDPAINVRHAVAAHPLAPPSILAALVADESQVVRERALRRRQPPPEPNDAHRSPSATKLITGPANLWRLRDMYWSGEAATISEAAFACRYVAMPILDALADAGEPLALLHPAVKFPALPRDQQSVVARVAVPLCRLLWQELGLLGAIEFHYQRDDYNGDSFYPKWPYGAETPQGSAIDVLSEGFSTTWIHKSEGVDYDYVLDADLGNTSYLFEIDDEWSEARATYGVPPLSGFFLAWALVQGESRGDVTILNRLRLHPLLEREDPYDLATMTRVTPTAARLGGLSYEHLPEVNQAAIVSALLGSLEDEALGGVGGIAEHLLTGIARHPSTSPSVLVDIAATHIEVVLEALADNPTFVDQDVLPAEQ